MRIYFSGIGGVGIGSLAEVAADAGHEIVGSDPSPSLTADELLSRGVVIHSAQDGSALRAEHEAAPLDRFVYTAALPQDHPELVAARELGIPTGKRDELLRELLDDLGLDLIAVSASHGKTTTTGMAIWALQQLGVPVSWSIGTTLSYGPSGRYQPGSRLFVYECDEFDRNFLNFHPRLALIPSLGYDHSDTYATPEDYRAAFAQFARQSQQTIAWADQQGSVFESIPGVVLLGDRAVDDTLPLAGAHNRRNASLVVQGLTALGIPGDLAAAVSGFPGTDRRFELLAENLVSDYGHHPVEIAATLQLARELSDRVVLVYQPHQNVRQHELLGHYTDQFEAAEHVYWLPTYLSREDPALRILEPSELIATVTNRDAVTPATWGDELWARLERHRAEGALVLAMGAGTIDGWVRERLG